MGLPYAAYTRVSRVGDREETLISPELQADRIRQYAAARGLALEFMAPELDVSGGKSERPILDQVILGIEHGRYAGVIVADIDRLSRMNLAAALQVIDRIERARGQVIAVAQNFDAATPEGEWARNVWLSTANMMLKRYGAAFRSAKQSAVERGVWPMPKAPLGYTVTRRKAGGDGKLKINPANRNKIVAAFEARAAGKPWTHLAQALGVGQTNAKKIITNRVYLGELRLGEWVNVAAHDPIVGRALFEAAQLSHPRPARRGNPPALLAGLVRCAGCQCAMTPSSDGHGSTNYRCTPNNKAGGRCGEPAIISRPKIDGYVEGVALGEIARLSITARERTDALDLARDEVQDAEAELTAYHETARVAELGGPAFAAGVRARERAVDDARSHLGDAWAAAAPAKTHLAGTLGDVWPDLTVEERRQVLRSSLSVIWVKKGKGSAAGRVRLIANGYEPASLRRRHGRREELAPIPWVEHFDGEIMPTLPQSAT